MLVEFLSTLFFIFNILLIILVVMQKNHGGFWSGPAGNDSVNVFGGNQGADVLQKITWAFGAILIFGCLFLSVYQASQSQISQFFLVEIKEEIANSQKIESDISNKTETDKIEEKKEINISPLESSENKEINNKENLNIKKDKEINNISSINKEKK